jgi:DNA polymerase I-like protein with 3'-5' exonuclease and polymerase domains
MKQTLKLSFEMTNVLSRIESNGLKINRATLDQIEEQYMDEMSMLENKLNRLAKNAMGDTPINLASPDDKSVLLYSRKVKDKALWSMTFNLGHEMRGNTIKPKMKTRMKNKDFVRYVRQMTDIVYKTVGRQCETCRGSGRVTPLKKDGSAGRAKRICKTCIGKGVVYTSTGEVAGFKLIPRTTHDTASAGFKTDKVTLEDRLSELEGDAREFCEAYVRYNALRTYLSTFVEGMKNNVDENDFIHPEFMQCVTATGRLSSRNPNFQNMPRGSTFAIRKVVESRFEGGKILEGDYSQLEFRVAGFLAKDSNVYADVIKGTDVHSYTASIIGCSRQEAKAHTFKPLYGGVSGTRSQQAYYQKFKEKYEQVSEWHKELEKQAVSTKIIKLPSGREYSFPDARWTEWGSATNRTAICNYPVQGFATADLLPIALVKLDELMRKLEMKSVICNTVHDSIVLDVHPSEEQQCIKVLSEAMLCLPNETKRRYGIEYDMPVGIELKIGKNWLDLSEVNL